MHVDAFAPGTFCWNELAAADVPVARRFYTALFGWGAVDHPIPGAGLYTLLQKDGRDVCALYGRRDGQRTSWSSFVSVPDVDACAARAVEGGGALVVPPFDVADADAPEADVTHAQSGPGRMCIAADPAGATFCLWQPRAHAGAGVVGEAASVVWNELATPDPHGAAVFYGRVLGWVADVVEVRPRTSSPTTYTTFYACGAAVDADTGERKAARVAGALGMNDAWEGVPPHWTTYFGADDVAGTAARAQGLGGKVLVAPFYARGVGDLATLADPGGAVFSILRPD